MATYIGPEVFRLFEDCKRKHKDIDTWVAEAVRAEFGADKMPAIMAAKICKNSRLPWENASVFENIALVLNGREVFPEIDQDITVKEIAYAVKVMKSQFPDEDFNDYVCQYWAAEAGEEGIAVLPPELKSAQRFIPPLFLNKEQQEVQNLYLEEIADYIKFLDSATKPVGGER
jgi:hypothetical protein